ncbi:MAG: threonyl-tRNA synthetase editing domain-containing protein [Candidatus Buchananbacteria bacterium]
MHLLLLHCKEFSYKLDHPTPIADRNVFEKVSNYQNALVVFVAIEKGDKGEKVDRAILEIIKLADTLKIEKIIINPFAHLSSTLAPAEQAREFSQLISDKLKEKTKLSIIYTSFGWYKSFVMDVFGHSNSQTWREF